MPEDAPTKINDRTTVPLTWVVAIVVSLVTGCGTVIGAYAWLDGQFDAVRERLISVESKLDADRQDRWVRSDMRTWVADFKAANPTLNVPPLPAPAPDPKK